MVTLLHKVHGVPVIPAFYLLIQWDMASIPKVTSWSKITALAPVIASTFQPSGRKKSWKKMKRVKGTHQLPWRKTFKSFHISLLTSPWTDLCHRATCKEAGDEVFILEMCCLKMSWHIIMEEGGKQMLKNSLCFLSQPMWMPFFFQRLQFLSGHPPGRNSVLI